MESELVDQTSNPENKLLSSRQDIIYHSSRSIIDRLDAPLKYLSSNQAGWEGLMAEAFLEPMQLHSWKSQTSPDITLILFAGGPLFVDRCYEDGPRIKQVMHDGELVLKPGASAPYEVSWKGLSLLPTRTLYLHLKRDLFARTAEELTGHDLARLSMARLDCFQDPLLRHIGFALWQELEQSVPAGKLYAETAAQMLAVHLLRHYTSGPLRIKQLPHSLTQRQMKRVTDFVTANLDQDLSLEALAEQVGFSSYHFARLFRQAAGESPHQFVLRQRIEKAQYLLRETNTPLAVVAIESGFANQSHLTFHFKRQLGITPKAYRQKF